MYDLALRLSTSWANYSTIFLLAIVNGYCWEMFGVICMMLPMSSSSNLSQTYVKFVNLVQAIRQKDRLFPIDPVDERLLSSFAAVWGTGQRLTASDAALIVPDVAPRTVQRRVAALIDKGMLRVESDAKDNRIKYFLATDKANAYFAELGKCLQQANGS